MAFLPSGMVYIIRKTVDCHTAPTAVTVRWSETGESSIYIEIKQTHSFKRVVSRTDGFCLYERAIFAHAKGGISPSITIDK